MSNDPTTLIATVLIVALCLMYWRITAWLLATGLIVFLIYGMISALHA